MKTRLILVSFALAACFGQAAAESVVINEFMAVNNTVLADEDGQYSDWIELFNASSNSVDLNGWYLTDKPGDLTRWALPSTNLPAGGYLVVFASGKNRSIAGQQLHTDFSLQGAGEYLALVKSDGLTIASEFAPLYPQQYGDMSYGLRNELELVLVAESAFGRYRIPNLGDAGLAWTGRFYDDDAWPAGANGLGYENAPADFVALINTAIASGTLSLYTRFEFTLNGTEVFDSLSLDVRYDDGFVAYLNGVKIAESNAPALPGPLSTATAERLNVDAVQLQSIDVAASLNALTDGVNVLAVHGLNVTNTSSDMLLSVALTGGNSNSLTTLRYFATPTPGLANSTGYQAIAESPVFSLAGGFYTNTQELTISAGTPGAVIRYTLDGAEPDATSPVLSAALPIASRNGDPNVFSAIQSGPGIGQSKEAWLPAWVPPSGEVFKSTVVRARVYAPGKLPSPIVTQTYFVDPAMVGRYGQLPVVALTSDAKHLFDNATGIYVPGNLYSGNRTGNYFQDLEKPCHLEWYEPDGSLGFAQNLGIKIQGNTSRASPIKGLLCYARSEYGDNRFDYPLFETVVGRARDEKSFKRFMLRGWSSFVGRGMIYDGYAQVLFDDTDLDIQNYRPVVVFINGEFWGVHELRESNKNSFYYEQYYGIDRVDPGYDILNGRGPYVDYEPTSVTDYTFIDEGDGTNWQAMLTYLNTHDMSDPAEYAFMQTWIDIPKYILYLVHSVVAMKGDWNPANGQNEAKWRARTPDGQWTWPQFDCDHCFHDSWTGNLMSKMTTHEIYIRLALNQEFRYAVINAFADRMNANFKTDYMMEVFTNMVGELEPFMAEHFERWAFGSVGNWNTWLDDMESNIQNRTAQARAHLLPVFPEITGIATLTLNVETQNLGVVQINRLRLEGDTKGAGDPVYPWEGIYYTGIPMQLAAIPAEGYEFQEWQGLVASTTNPLTFSITGDATVTAVFAEFDPAEYPIVISEVMYNPAPGAGILESNECEFIELCNRGISTVNLKGFTFMDGVDFTFDQNTLLPPGGYLVVVNNRDWFAARYDTNAIWVAGVYNGSLNNGGETLTLGVSPWGPRLSSFDYRDARGWPYSADGGGHSLVPRVLDDQLLGVLDYGGNWRASHYRHGSPGTADPDITPDLLLNELMAHTDFDDTNFPGYDSDDWIELFNTTSNAIVLNDWYLSDEIGDLKRWAIPDGTVVAAGGRISFAETTDFHVPITNGFGLNKAGEQVLLSHLPGTANDRVADWVRFKGEANGIALGRPPDGNPYWEHLEDSRDAPNGSPFARLVISEIMAHPMGSLPHPDDNQNDEYIEIHNPTTNAIAPQEAAGLWRLDGGVAFTFPAGTVLAAGDYLAVVSFDPLVDVASRDAFFAAYNLTNGQIQLLGPYGGKLSNRGERIALERPQAPDALGEGASWYMVDEVIYATVHPWPTTVSGTGRSLRRIDLLAPGRDPAAWATDLFPSPGLAPAKLAMATPDGGSEYLLPHMPILSAVLDYGQVSGVVQHVTFTVNGQPVHTDATDPYAYAYPGFTNAGHYTVTAAMVDDSGTHTSAPILIVGMTIDNAAGASEVTEQSARLNGTLAGDGHADIKLYWGPEDGGTNPASWAGVVLRNHQGEGPIAATISGLLLGERYYYRAFAETDYNTAWAPASAAFDVSYAAWSNSLQIALTGLTVGETLLNFPVLVRLSTNIAGFAYSQFTSPIGADLRFGPSLDEPSLMYDIESWDTNGESAVWVKVPVLTPGINWIWAFWGNDGATVPPSYTQDGSTWSANYKGVWHLHEDVWNAATNSGGGITNGSVSGSGLIAGDHEFDGVDDDIDPEIPTSWYADNSLALTISLWAKPEAGDDATVFGAHTGGRASPLYMAQEGGQWEFAIRNTSTFNSEHSVITNQWQQLTLVLSNSVGRAYWNGEPAPTPLANAAFAPSARPLIGTRNGQVGTNYRFHGGIDEVRVAGAARTPAWGRASYLTVASNAMLTAYTYGLLPSGDVDGDGLPDVWERMHFLSTDNPGGDPTNDWDLDHMSNLDELIAGTDPTNALDVFKLNIDLSGGSLQVSFMGLETGVELTDYSRFYRVEQTTNLLLNDWQGVPNYTNLSGANAMIMFSDVAPVDHVKHYRGAVWLQEP
ncbi:MAG: lamin tail domain-containing protein [Verrucomicrobia bacterium]|nr:lamin tail domain-containing protein [Verrucomicrobiota bacterium]